MAFKLLNWIEKTSEYYNFSYICTYKEYWFMSLSIKSKK